MMSCEVVKALVQLTFASVIVETEISVGSPFPSIDRMERQLSNFLFAIVVAAISIVTYEVIIIIGRKREGLM